MSTEYPSSWDCCATCAFWIGHREIDYFCQYVKVDSPTHFKSMYSKTLPHIDLNQKILFEL